MSNALVAFVLAAGVSGWVYAQAQRRNGGLTKNSMIIAGIFGAFAFLVMWTVLLMIF